MRLVADAGRDAQDRQATVSMFLDGETRTSPDALHILHRSLGPKLQLVIDRGCSLDAPLEARIPISLDGLDRMAALDRLLRHFLGYKVPPDLRITTQQRRRLKAMLRAVDAREHDASQREIARVLFGVERIASEHWKTSSLRDAVSGLLEYGDVMIGGGYLKLLRFRRRR